MSTHVADEVFLLSNGVNVYIYKKKYLRRRLRRRQGLAMYLVSVAKLVDGELSPLPSIPCAFHSSIDVATGTPHLKALLDFLELS